MTHGGENGSTLSPHKVYVINRPEQSATRKSDSGNGGKQAARTRGRPTTSRATKGNSWRLALRAYALGPLNLILWPSGRGRLAWAVVGAGSLIAVALLCIWWGKFFEVVESLQHGATVWVVSVVLVILLAATAWARAVATSARVSSWPRSLRKPGVVCALGLVLPGLGLLIARRRRKAALAIWCAGLFVAAILVSKHWRWLLAEGVGGTGGVTHQSIESLLVVAVSCVVFGFFAWLILAFDGVRAVSPVARSGSVANRLALALLVLLVLFLATFRPTSIARDLESAAAQLQYHNLRIIPLALYEVASILDAGTPTYLAGAATLCDEMGLRDTAEAKRDLLHKRATQFASAVGAELVPTDTHESEMRLPWLNRPLDTSDHVPPHGLSIESANADYQGRAEDVQ